MSCYEILRAAFALSPSAFDYHELPLNVKSASHAVTPLLAANLADSRPLSSAYQYTPLTTPFKILKLSHHGTHFPDLNSEEMNELRATIDPLIMNELEKGPLNAYKVQKVVDKLGREYLGGNLKDIDKAIARGLYCLRVTFYLGSPLAKFRLIEFQEKLHLPFSIDKDKGLAFLKGNLEKDAQHMEFIWDLKNLILSSKV